jgi:hypothetical protein
MQQDIFNVMQDREFTILEIVLVEQFSILVIVFATTDITIMENSKRLSAMNEIPTKIVSRFLFLNDEHD